MNRTRTSPRFAPRVDNNGANRFAGFSPVRHTGLALAKRHPLSARVAEPTQASHSERVLAMRLEHLQCVRPAGCQQLDEDQNQTAGDFSYGTAKDRRTFPQPRRAERAIRRYRAAIQSSRSASIR